jgi:hypothetical protein
MIDNYKFVRRFNADLFGLYSAVCGRQMWTSCVKRSPAATCVVTGKMIEKGERCFRPVGHPKNRFERISDEGMKRLKAERESLIGIRFGSALKEKGETL